MDEKIAELLKKVISEIKNLKNDVALLKSINNVKASPQKSIMEEDTWDPSQGPPPASFRAKNTKATFAYEDMTKTKKRK